MDKILGQKSEQFLPFAGDQGRGLTTKVHIGALGITKLLCIFILPVVA